MQVPLTEIRTTGGGSGSAGMKSCSVLNILNFHNWILTKWKDLGACCISSLEASGEPGGRGR